MAPVHHQFGRGGFRPRRRGRVDQRAHSYHSRGLDGEHVAVLLRHERPWFKRRRFEKRSVSVLDVPRRQRWIASRQRPWGGWETIVVGWWPARRTRAALLDVRPCHDDWGRDWVDPVLFHFTQCVEIQMEKGMETRLVAVLLGGAAIGNRFLFVVFGTIDSTRKRNRGRPSLRDHSQHSHLWSQHLHHACPQTLRLRGLAQCHPAPRVRFVDGVQTKHAQCECDAWSRPHPRSPPHASGHWGTGVQQHEERHEEWHGGEKEKWRASSGLRPDGGHWVWHWRVVRSDVQPDGVVEGSNGGATTRQCGHGGE